MQNARSLSRADFLRLTFGGAAAALAFAACGGSGAPEVDAATGDDPDAPPGTPDAADGDPDAAAGDPDAAPASCLEDGGQVTIGGNHGHELVVSAVDVQAGDDKTYDIQGASGHTHTVTITAAVFAMLADGTTIQVTSSSAGHTHSVTVSCG